MPGIVQFAQKTFISNESSTFSSARRKEIRRISRSDQIIIEAQKLFPGSRNFHFPFSKFFFLETPFSFWHVYIFHLLKINRVTCLFCNRDFAHFFERASVAIFATFSFCSERVVCRSSGYKNALQNFDSIAVLSVKLSFDFARNKSNARALLRESITAVYRVFINIGHLFQDHSHKRNRNVLYSFAIRSPITER